MKKKLVRIALISIMLVGLSVMLYPAVSDYLNSFRQSRVIASYKDNAAQLSGTDCRELLESAREYNKKLVYKNNRFTFTDKDMKELLSAFDFTGTGNIGVVNIGAIGVSLPIYLGTSEGVLQIGTGLFEGSSLPVGGAGTHSVILGHRGLQSSMLFTNLDKLAIGDTFTLQVLTDTLTYEIDQIEIVTPYDFSLLSIDPDEDYCTLLTCTPYGVNSHRLLVRGRRVFPGGALRANSRDDSRVAQAAALLLLFAAAFILKNARAIIAKAAGRKYGCA